MLFQILRNQERIQTSLAADRSRFTVVRLQRSNHVEQHNSEQPSPSSPVTARLNSCPKTLFDLWNEYEFGTGLVKPAKLFTSRERGANKYSYSRRKHFGDTVARMIRQGYTSDAAIDRIYEVYGGPSSTVSSVLLGLRRDNKNGGHSALQ